MRKFLCFAGICVFCMIGCDADIENAAAYPTEIVDNTYEATEITTIDDGEDFLDYLKEIFGEDQDKWPEDIKNNYHLIAFAINNGKPTTVTAEAYTKVSEVVLYEYCSWYEPNSTLTISLSSVNEVSVSESITASVGANVGHGGVGISASISKQTTKTVTTASGIQVTTSHDLTRYNQDKLYKVVLVGNYAGVKYTFAGEQHLGGSFTYYGDGILVDQGSLAVRLVCKNK